MKSFKPFLDEICDHFSQEILCGEVIGSTSDCGAVRLGVDVEAKISVEAGGVRFAPLDTPGWGRQGIAYGPFAHKAGLACGVFMLNGHNNSQTPGQDSNLQPQQSSLKSSYRARFSPSPLRENLAVGWFNQPLPSNPLKAGQAFVMQGHPSANGRLCAAKIQGLHHLLLDIPNNPIYFLTVLREKGAVFYTGLLEGSRHLPALPRVRPVAIDPYDLGAEVLYAGVYQSILGENGYRAGTRIYGVRVTQQGYGTALVVVPQPQLGRRAALGGVLGSPGILLHPEEPGGLFHVRLTAPASLIWRYRDPEHYLALELTPRRSG